MQHEENSVPLTVLTFIQEALVTFTVLQGVKRGIFQPVFTEETNRSPTARRTLARFTKSQHTHYGEKVVLLARLVSVL